VPLRAAWVGGGLAVRAWKVAATIVSTSGWIDMGGVTFPQASDTKKNITTSPNIFLFILPSLREYYLVEYRC